MRFYEVDRGEIAVDGNSIAKLRRSALRGMYGMVPVSYTHLDVYKRQACTWPRW